MKYIFTDSDKKIVRIKGDDAAKLEYEQKCDRFKQIPQVYGLDFEEIGCREFIDYVFERRVDYSDVSPFEDKMSNEYVKWLEQKKAGKKQIDYRGYSCWRYNPIAFYSENKKGYHRILLRNDEETLDFLDGRDFAIMAPITYVGRNNTALNARYLYAFAFDIDGVGIKQLNNIVFQMHNRVIPVANIITNSGHGLHLYYILKNPVPLYRENISLLNQLKHGLTNLLWNEFNSFLDNRQYQSVFQGFRLPGTMTKFGVPIKSYYNHDSALHNLEDLNNFLDAFRLTEKELGQINKVPIYNPTGVTLEEAKRQWPEWYASRVLQHKIVGKKWHVKRDVYDWWLNRLRHASANEIKVHHRYWCILTLVVYAIKCDISKDEVRADAYSLVPLLDSYTDSEDNHFTTDDVDDAMKAYDENYNKWTIETIENTTAFRIDRNKRNGRKQADHLRRARILRDADHLNGSWRFNADNPGRDKVRTWREEHPGNDNKSQCARETGLSRQIVRKWWNPIAQESPETNKDLAAKTEQKSDKKQTSAPVISVSLTKLFAPGSDYTIPGYSHNEVITIVTSDKWKLLGWEIAT